MASHTQSGLCLDSAACQSSYQRSTVHACQLVALGFFSSFRFSVKTTLCNVPGRAARVRASTGYERYYSCMTKVLVPMDSMCIRSPPVSPDTVYFCKSLQCASSHAFTSASS
eukprot:scpid69384/ scgid17588/ 